MRTKVSRNQNMKNLRGEYLFHEISRRETEHVSKHPDAKLIDLGSGNTSQPIPHSISSAMARYTLALSTVGGYHGYGAEEGGLDLRKAIVENFYKDLGITCDEIFVSDGSQGDLSRLQILLGPDVTVTVQDPSYPIFVDSSVIMGHAGVFQEHINNHEDAVYMHRTPDNDFFPDLTGVARTDVIFFCNPNNPTGHTASRQELEELVDFARKNGSILIYDSAYSTYISDDSPRSIFEIRGAKEVAIEVSTFSKFAGFTGVRLGWTVIPKQLLYADGHKVIEDYTRVVCTSFCGASNIAQVGGIACLAPEGFKELRGIINYYMENARILADTFKSLGYEVYGGKHVPFIWVHFPGTKSWDMFDEILENAHVGTTPGIGFGSKGDEFLRFSSFGRREVIIEASLRLKKHFSKGMLTQSDDDIICD